MRMGLLLLGFIIFTPIICSIATCKLLRKRSVHNIDRWLLSLRKKLSLTNFSFSMLDVASSRAHACLLDGQLGFGFDSWLWCLLSFVIVFAENLSRKSSTIVSFSSTFGNRFANVANDGSSTTSHLTDVNKNIVWFEVDFGEPYSIDNFKLYYRKKLFAVKKSIQNKDVIMIDYYYDLKKTKSNVGFTENKIQ